MSSVLPVLSVIVLGSQSELWDDRALVGIGRDQFSKVTNISNFNTNYIVQHSQSTVDYATTSASVTSNRITWNFDLSWADEAWTQDYALGVGTSVVFTITEPVSYRVSGGATFQDDYGATNRISMSIDDDIPPIMANYQQTQGEIGDLFLPLQNEPRNGESSVWNGLEGLLEPGTYQFSASAGSSDWGVGHVEGAVLADYRGPITGSGSVTMELTPIPEPSIGVLLLASLPFFAFRKRKY